MKLKYIIVIISIIIIGGVLFVVLKKKEKPVVEISDITYFSMFYTKGYMINSDIRYRIEYDEEQGKDMVTIKPYGISDEDGLKMEVPEGLFGSIKDILVKYEVNKWNGFKENDKDVLDGDSFSLYVKFNNEQQIEASGYMRWPENYRSVRDEIDELFMNIYNKEKGIENE